MNRKVEVSLWILIGYLVLVAWMALQPSPEVQLCMDVQHFEDGSIIDHCSNVVYDPDIRTWAPVP